GRGMGVDIAKAALAAGNAVVATGRNPERVSTAIGEADDLLAVKLDVPDPTDAAPKGRFPKATALDPALRLLEEHGWLRRVDADPSGPKGCRPPPPRFLVNPLHPSTEPTEPTQPHLPTGSVGCVGSVARGDASGSPR